MLPTPPRLVPTLKAGDIVILDNSAATRARQFVTPFAPSAQLFFLPQYSPTSIPSSTIILAATGAVNRIRLPRLHESSARKTRHPFLRRGVVSHARYLFSISRRYLDHHGSALPAALNSLMSARRLGQRETGRHREQALAVAKPAGDVGLRTPARLER